MDRKSNAKEKLLKKTKEIGWQDLRDYHWNIYITICKRASGSLMNERVLWDNLEEYGGERGGFRREGTYVHLWPVYVDVQQKPSQCCKKKKKKS